MHACAASANETPAPGKPRIVSAVVTAGTSPCTASLVIGFGIKQVPASAASQHGPLDATALAIRKVVPHDARMVNVKFKTLGSGTDAIGRVTVTILFEGKTYRAFSDSVDIVLAFARAYLGALNQTRLLRP